MLSFFCEAVQRSWSSWQRKLSSIIPYVEQLLLAKHDAAGDRMIHAVGTFQNFLRVIYEEIVTGNSIRVTVLVEIEVQEVQEIVVNIIVGINADDVFRPGRHYSAVYWRREARDWFHW